MQNNFISIVSFWSKYTWNHLIWYTQLVGIGAIVTQLQVSSFFLNIFFILHPVYLTVNETNFKSIPTKPILGSQQANLFNR